jgi:RHS repeat-associated protein
MSPGVHQHPTADVNLSGALDFSDLAAISSQVGTTLGWGKLSQDNANLRAGNRQGYAGYEFDPVLAYSVWHVRHRVLNSDLGRWNRRDPLWRLEGYDPYSYVTNNPLAHVDSLGLVPLSIVAPWQSYPAWDGCICSPIWPPCVPWIQGQLNNLGCAQPNIVYVNCPAGPGAEYGGYDIPTNTIYICMNNIANDDPQLCGAIYLHTLQEEMLHALDTCWALTMGLTPTANCGVVFCAEFRAKYYFDPSCKGLPETQRLTCAFNKAGQSLPAQCVPVIQAMDPSTLIRRCMSAFSVPLAGTPCAN